MDHEGIKTLLQKADERFPRLSHLWLDAGYRGEDKGADWVQKTLGWSVELVERPRKPAPKEVLMRWAREWADEGVAVDWQRLLPPKGFLVLPRRWVVERTLSWIEKNRRMSKDYERFLCASGEALVYAAMIRLMTRRPARVRGLFIQPLHALRCIRACRRATMRCPSPIDGLSSAPAGR
jgi:putative transposase